MSTPRRPRPSGEIDTVKAGVPQEIGPERSSGRRRVASAEPAQAGATQPAPAPASPSAPPIPLTEPRVDQYLDRLFASTDPVLVEMERIAAEERFPIVGPVVGRLLRQLAVTVSARDVFEMGSGFGYSTWFLAQAVGDGGRVVHTDFSPERSQLARRLLGQAGLGGRVTYEVGDALQVLVHYPGPFDLIFIDVDKEGYPEALELARARVRPGGYIVTDNVLWHGRVLDPPAADAATQAVLRYTRAALAAPDLMTTILPLRDGVALHLKLPEPRRRR